MELFRKLFSVIKALNENGLEYSVVGGIALASHAESRFARDIEILGKPMDPPFYEEILSGLGRISIVDLLRWRLKSRFLPERFSIRRSLQNSGRGFAGWSV